MINQKKKEVMQYLVQRKKELLGGRKFISPGDTVMRVIEASEHNRRLLREIRETVEAIKFMHKVQKPEEIDWIHANLPDGELR